MNNNLMSIIIVGFDGYSDIWDANAFLWKKFWPNCNFKLFFVNNIKDIHYDNFIQVKTFANAGLTSRLKAALLEVDSKYVLVLLEDFLFAGKVKESEIDRIVDFIDAHNVDYCRLNPVPRSTKRFLGMKEFRVISKSKHYGVNLQPAIWKRESLLSACEFDVSTPWQFEVAMSENKNRGYWKEKRINIHSYRHDLNLCHAIEKGKIYPEANKLLLSNGFSKSPRIELSKKEIKDLKRQTLLIRILPDFIRINLKKILRIFGVKFYTNQ